MRGDVCSLETLEQLFDAHRIDGVIHFAAHKAVGDSVRTPLAYYRNNLISLLNLLEVMRTRQVKTLVFSSSATVYGDPATVPLDETAPLSATNPYAQTKLAGERILADLAASDPAWCIATLRYFNPVGAHESGLIGEDPSGIPNNLMPFVARVASGRLPCCACSGATGRRRTAPACAITSMWSIWRAVISRRWRPSSAAERLHGQPGHRTRVQRAGGHRRVRARQRPAGAL